MSILRYAVNAYVIGTTTAGEQGLYRIQLGDDNNWQSPQLLLPGITAMNISYGYVGNCAPSGAAASDVSRETFTFTNALDDKQNPPTPALDPHHAQRQHLGRAGQRYGKRCLAHRCGQCLCLQY
jgi:type IV pilus assembly protein PilW